MKRIVRLRRALAARARAMRVGIGRPGSVPIIPLASRAGSGTPIADPVFDSDRAWEHLERQCASGPRVPGSEGHRRTEAWILERLAEVSDTVAVQRWKQRIFRGAGAGRALPMTNILARIGAGPVGLMLATHWDTRPVADRDPDPKRRHLPIPGANDGASGVAVLLEVARVLSNVPPSRSVIMAFFDGEDLGDHFYGSEVFAGELRAGRAGEWRPEAAVVADMVGKRNLRFTSELHSMRFAPDVWREVRHAAAAISREDLFDGPPSAINDDHMPLNRVGVPAVLLIDYDYPAWHAMTDTPDQCDRASLDAVGRLLIRVARAWP